MGGARIKYFYRILREQVILLIRNSMTGDGAEILQGGSYSLDVFYHEDGEGERVSVSPGSAWFLPEVLDRAEGKALPSPFKFGLPFKTVRLRIVLDSGGQVNVSIAPL